MQGYLSVHPDPLPLDDSNADLPRNESSELPFLPDMSAVMVMRFSLPFAVCLFFVLFLLLRKRPWTNFVLFSLNIRLCAPTPMRKLSRSLKVRPIGASKAVNCFLKRLRCVCK